MDDLTLVRTELQKVDLKDVAAIAESSRVPEDTIIKIKYGTTKNPRYETVALLAGYFRRVIAAQAA